MTICILSVDCRRPPYPSWPVLDPRNITQGARPEILRPSHTALPRSLRTAGVDLIPPMIFARSGGGAGRPDPHLTSTDVITSPLTEGDLDRGRAPDRKARTGGAAPSTPPPGAMHPLATPL